MNFRQLLVVFTLVSGCVFGANHQKLNGQAVHLNDLEYASQDDSQLGVNLNLSDQQFGNAQGITLSPQSVMLPPETAAWPQASPQMQMQPQMQPTEFSTEMESDAHYLPVVDFPIQAAETAVSQCEEPTCATSSRLGLKERRAIHELNKYGEPKIKIKEMWERDLPLGDQSLHFPYNTPKMYYYRRPYNSSHISQARTNRDTALNGYNYSGAYPYPGQPYRTDVFQNVNRSHAYAQYGSVESRSLEFVDWRKHQQAKTQWDQMNPKIAEPATIPTTTRPNGTPTAVPGLLEPISPPEPAQDNSIYLSGNRPAESPLQPIRNGN